MSLSTSQAAALHQLSREHQADGVAIVKTAMQIADALGSALFVGIMTVCQNTYIKNTVHAVNASNHSVSTAGMQVKAIYSGFDHSVFIAAVVIGAGFVLSLFLRKRTAIKGTDNA